MDNLRNKLEVLSQLEAMPFAPALGLTSAHLQTTMQPLFRRNVSIVLLHQKLAADDGEVLDLFCSEEFSSPSSPVVLIAHGLEGSHESPYVRGLQLYLRERGWGSAALVHRSCLGVINERTRTYHSGETGDLASAAHFLTEKYPERPLFVVGYSLSGNQVAKWFGTEGARLPRGVTAGAAVSPPFDLSVTSRRIDASLFGVYRRHFLKTLRPKGMEKAERYPELLNRKQVRDLVTLRDFDDAVTAPLHGFESGEDYYRKVAWLQFSRSVQRPLLILASKDDPFSPGDSIPESLGSSNGCLHLLLTERGGHVGFVGGSLMRPVYWSESQIFRFFEFYRDKRPLTSTQGAAEYR